MTNASEDQRAALPIEQAAIMVFVGKRGCIQIPTGPMHSLRQAGPWFNVLDPGFNLHLRETAIDTAWQAEDRDWRAALARLPDHAP